MNLNQLDVIRRWFRKSKEMDNPFDKFIALWVSFNSFYACEHLHDSEAMVKSYSINSSNRSSIIFSLSLFQPNQAISSLTLANPL